MGGILALLTQLLRNKWFFIKGTSALCGHILLSLIQHSSKGLCLSSLLDKFLPSPSKTQHASLMKDLMFYFSKGLEVTVFHDCRYLCTAQLKGRTQSNFKLMSWSNKPLFLPTSHQRVLHSKAVSVIVCLLTNHLLGIFMKGTEDTNIRPFGRDSSFYPTAVMWSFLHASIK